MTVLERPAETLQADDVGELAGRAEQRSAVAADEQRYAFLQGLADVDTRSCQVVLVNLLRTRVRNKLTRTAEEGSEHPQRLDETSLARRGRVQTSLNPAIV